MATGSLYQVLGLVEGASQEEVKAAFRRRCLETHPDKGGDAEKFKAVVDAFETLYDAQRRARYDHQMKEDRGAPFAPHRPQTRTSQTEGGLSKPAKFRRSGYRGSGMQAMAAHPEVTLEGLLKFLSTEARREVIGWLSQEQKSALEQHMLRGKLPDAEPEQEGEEQRCSEGLLRCQDEPARLRGSIVKCWDRSYFVRIPVANGVHMRSTATVSLPDAVEYHCVMAAVRAACRKNFPDVSAMSAAMRTVLDSAVQENPSLHGLSFKWTIELTFWCQRVKMPWVDSLEQVFRHSEVLRGAYGRSAVTRGNGQPSLKELDTQYDRVKAAYCRVMTECGYPEKELPKSVTAAFLKAHEQEEEKCREYLKRAEEDKGRQDEVLKGQIRLLLKVWRI